MEAPVLTLLHLLPVYFRVRFKMIVFVLKCLNDVVLA